jgi:hypothetical protein
MKAGERWLQTVGLDPDMFLAVSHATGAKCTMDLTRWERVCVLMSHGLLANTAAFDVN